MTQRAMSVWAPNLALVVVVAAAASTATEAADKVKKAPAQIVPGAPTAEAGQFKITVVRVRKATGSLHIKFDWSRASMNFISGVFEGAFTPSEPDQIKKFAEGFVPEIAYEKPGAISPPSGLPNLAVDLVVDPPPKTKLVYELSSNGSATDDRGNTLGSMKIGIHGKYRMSDDPYGVDLGTILLFQAEAGATKLAQLDGELLAGPGRRLEFTFPAQRLETSVSKKSGDTVVRLEEIKHEDGRIRVTVSHSGLAFPKNPFNPEQAFKGMAKSAAMLDLVIRGSDRKVYYYDQMSGSGGLSQSSSISFTAGKEVKSNQTSGDDLIRSEFVFQQLPRQVSISTIEATLTIHDGETKRIPFTLRNVPIPFPAEPAN